jgi:hypothetical protein
MKKTIFYWTVAVAVVVFVAVFYFATIQTTSAQPTVDEQIRFNLSLQWDLLTSINYYRSLKDDCLNKLTLTQSDNFITHKEVYCYEFDDIIQSEEAQLKQLYTEIKEFTTREYMTVGL